MNREHLFAFLWLRWRLQVNQFRKAGALNAILFFFVVGFALVGSVVLTRRVQRQVDHEQSLDHEVVLMRACES